MKNVVILLTVVFFLSGSSESRPFDVSGFKSGMSKQEVKEIIKQMKLDKVREEENSITAYDKPEKESHRFYDLDFCKDKLFAVQEGYKPSMKHFIILFKETSDKCGKPIASNPKTFLITEGEVYSLSFSWLKNKEEIGLDYTVFPNNDSLSVNHWDSSVCDKNR